MLFKRTLYTTLALSPTVFSLYPVLLASARPLCSVSHVTRVSVPVRCSVVAWGPDCPRAPLPSPAWVPTLPAPTCCCFHTPGPCHGGRGSPGGRDPELGAPEPHLSCARPYVRSLQTRLRHLALRSRRHELLWETIRTRDIISEWDYTAYKVARPGHTAHTDFLSFYGWL